MYSVQLTPPPQDAFRSPTNTRAPQSSGDIDVLHAGSAREFEARHFRRKQRQCGSDANARLAQGSELGQRREQLWAGLTVGRERGRRRGDVPSKSLRRLHCGSFDRSKNSTGEKNNPWPWVIRRGRSPPSRHAPPAFRCRQPEPGQHAEQSYPNYGEVH